MICGMVRMPQRIFCSGCGYVLYKGIELEIPSEVLSRLAGGQGTRYHDNPVCPQCGKTFEYDPMNVKFYDSDPQQAETETPSPKSSQK